MTTNKIAILELAKSHDECILSQVKGLKEKGCEIIFCGSKAVFQRNTLFKALFDTFYEVNLTGNKKSDFNEIKALNKWLKAEDVEKVICNTAQGNQIRNLALISLFNSIQYYGILHTIKKIPDSFTQKIISLKIKNYFVLNDTLLERIPPQKKLTINSFYPLDYPNFDESIEKNGKWRITIIGGVENRRKDLKGFINFAKKTSKKVQFVFLGFSDFKKEEVIAFKEQIDALKLNDKILLFNHFVSEEMFDAYLKETDLILPLVHPNTPSADEYFNRQISGAINIAFSYKIPMLIHKNYQDWEDFQTGCIFYDLPEMNSSLGRFFEEHKALKNELKDNPKFSAILQRERFASLVINE